MRIISGKFRGRHFVAPKTITARPTTDMAREGLFNIIVHNFPSLHDTDVLDLFGGIGSISYEFLSRNARSVITVENSVVEFRFIEETFKKLGCTNAHAIKGDVFAYLAKCSQKFGFIFADPPYGMENINTLPDIIFERGLLTNDGWFILEHDERTSFATHPRFKQHRRYGNVNFSIFY